MKLHLHIGAHKTATTHFQNVLEINKGLYPSGYEYIPMDEFRRNVTQPLDKGVNFCKSDFDEIFSSTPSVLIISEENISGHLNKILFNYDYLYPQLESRLTRLADFIKTFDEVEVWFSVRAMDSILPSMYCEFLRCCKFRPFEKILSGKYEQSWMPVINTIRECLPEAKINIVQYENYTSNLPKIISHIFNNNNGWNYQLNTRHRESFSHTTIDTFRKYNLIIPKFLTRATLNYISRASSKRQIGGKFSPFSQHQKQLLQSLYASDLATIKEMENVKLF